MLITIGCSCKNLRDDFPTIKKDIELYKALKLQTFFLFLWQRP